MKAAWLEPEWPAPPGVRVISTMRTGGASLGAYASFNLGDHVGDEAQSVAINRRELKAAAVLPSDPVWLSQVHGAAIADLDSAGIAGSADAAFTRQRGRVCAILTADCLPVMLAAASGEVVAAAHAGWRGLAAGVLEATVAALGLSGSQIVAWLGPAIGPAHFEVGEEVRETFVGPDPQAAGAFRVNSRGRFMADLPCLARARLARMGVTRIYGGEVCTFADAARFFSHRRDGLTGRQATLIWREA